MKTTLELTLPEEGYEFESAVNGQTYRSKLDEIEEMLRHLYKYEEHDESAGKMLDRIRDRFYEIKDS